MQQAEFHAHDDEVDLEDFCAIMERHKPENLTVDRGGSGSEHSDSRTESGSARRGDESGANDGGGSAGGGGGGGGSGGGGAGAGKVVVSRQEVISNLVELFKEVGAMLQVAVEIATRAVFISMSITVVYKSISLSIGMST